MPRILTLEEAKASKAYENLMKRVDELDISVRLRNCLMNAGTEFVYQLIEQTEARLLRSNNFGRKVGIKYKNVSFFEPL